MDGAGIQDLPDFAGAKGDSQISWDRIFFGGAVIGRNTGRHIHGQNQSTALLHLSDCSHRGQHVSAQGTCEAGSAERIHDEKTVLNQTGPLLLPGSASIPQNGTRKMLADLFLYGCGAARCGILSCLHRKNVPSFLEQEPRGGIAIRAIAAAAAEHHALFPSRHAKCFSLHCEGCPFNQNHCWNADRLRRIPVGVPHLFSRQKIFHRLRHLASPAGAVSGPVWSSASSALLRL